MNVDPWSVTGKVDYAKLIKQFGTSAMSKEILQRLEKHGKLHMMLRRGYYYSHRDLNLVLDDYEKKKGFFLYTGRTPSGPMHLGHLTAFLMNKWLQDVFDVNLYIQMPDEEKFLAKPNLTLEDTDAWIEDNMLDIIAMGFNPQKTFIFINSEYMSHFYRLICRIAKKVTLSTAKAVFGFTQQQNVGIMFYPIVQTAPAFFEKKRCLIAAGIDQDNYWRVQRDVAESLGYYKTAAIHSKFTPALTGPEGKMSSSEPNTAILTTDDPQTVRKKILKYAFSGGQPTVEEHRTKGGNPDIDVCYQWLSIFLEDDDVVLERIRRDYTSGKLLSGELKMILVEKLNQFLKNHQERRKQAASLIKTFKYDGSLAMHMWKTFL